MGKIDDVVSLLEYWLEEIKIKRSKRVPSRVRMKRKRYYRKHKASIKRKVRRRARRPRNKRLAKRRAKIRKRLHLKPGSRRRVQLSAKEFTTGRLMEAALNQKDQLIEGFTKVAQLIDELIDLKNEPKTESAEITDPVAAIGKFNLDEHFKVLMPQLSESKKVTVYDNGGKTFDRYTVVVDSGDEKEFYGMGKDPSGFNQFSGTDKDGLEEGPHLGRKISIKALPSKVQDAIKERAGTDKVEEKEETQLESLRTDALYLSNQVKDDKISLDEATELLEMFGKRLDALCEEEEEPSEEDIVITPAGRLGSQVSVGVVGGKHIGIFNTHDEAEDAIKEYMEKHKCYPQVWFQDDHGGVSKYQMENLSEIAVKVPSGGIPVDKVKKAMELVKDGSVSKLAVRGGPVENQLAHSLKVYQDRGEYDGSLDSAIESLLMAGYEIQGHEKEDDLEEEKEGVEDKAVIEMEAEYNYLPDAFTNAVGEGDTVYIHAHRNADHAIEHPTGGIRARVKKIYPFGLKLKIAAHILNTEKVKKGEHIFVSSTATKGKLLNGFVHEVDPSMNSGIVYVGAMSSHVVEGKDCGSDLEEGKFFDKTPYSIAAFADTALHDYSKDKPEKFDRKFRDEFTKALSDHLEKMVKTNHRFKKDLEDQDMDMRKALDDEAYDFLRQWVSKRHVKEAKDEEITDDDIYNYLEQWRDSENYTDFNLAMDKGLILWAAHLIDSGGAIDPENSDNPEMEKAIIKMLDDAGKNGIEAERQELLRDVEVWVDKYNHHAFIPTGGGVDYFLTKKDLEKWGFKFDGGYDSNGKRYKASKLDEAKALSERTGKGLIENHPELAEKLKEAMEDVGRDIDRKYETDGQIEEVEHMSRPGFASTSDGGYSFTAFAPLMNLIGSGSVGHLPDKAEEQVNKMYDYGLELAQEQFIEEYKEELKDIPKDKINYHDLYELKRGDLAEKLSEMEHEANADDTVMFLLQAFMEDETDRDQGVSFTVQGVVNWESPYHRSGKDREEFKQITVNFKDHEDMTQNFDKVTKTVKECAEFMMGKGSGGKSHIEDIQDVSEAKVDFKFLKHLQDTKPKLGHSYKLKGMWDHVDEKTSELWVNHKGEPEIIMFWDTDKFFNDHLDKDQNLTDKIQKDFEDYDGGGWADWREEWVKKQGWKVGELGSGNTYNEDNFYFWGDVFEFTDFKTSDGKEGVVIMKHIGGDVRGNYEYPEVYMGDFMDVYSSLSVGDPDEEKAQLFGYDGDAKALKADLDAWLAPVLPGGKKESIEEAKKKEKWVIRDWAGNYPFEKGHRSQGAVKLGGGPVYTFDSFDDAEEFLSNYLDKNKMDYDEWRGEYEIELVEAKKAMSEAFGEKHGSKADFISDVGDFGKVPHSELAMHTKTAGKKIVQYALFNRSGKPAYAHAKLDDGTMIDGLPREVLPHEVKLEDVDGWSSNAVKTIWTHLINDKSVSDAAVSAMKQGKLHKFLKTRYGLNDKSIDELSSELKKFHGLSEDSESVEEAKKQIELTSLSAIPASIRSKLEKNTIEDHGPDRGGETQFSVSPDTMGLVLHKHGGYFGTPEKLLLVKLEKDGFYWIRSTKVIDNYTTYSTGPRVVWTPFMDWHKKLKFDPRLVSVKNFLGQKESVDEAKKDDMIWVVTGNNPDYKLFSFKKEADFKKHKKEWEQLGWPSKKVAKSLWQRLQQMGIELGEAKEESPDVETQEGINSLFDDILKMQLTPEDLNKIFTSDTIDAAQILTNFQAFKDSHPETILPEPKDEAKKDEKDDEYFIQLAKDHHGTAVRDNSRDELISIGKAIDSGEDLDEAKVGKLVGKEALQDMVMSLEKDINDSIDKKGIELPHGDIIEVAHLEYSKPFSTIENGKKYNYPEMMHFNINSWNTMKLSMLADGKIIPEGSDLSGKGVSKQKVIDDVLQDVQDWVAHVERITSKDKMSEAKPVKKKSYENQMKQLAHDAGLSYDGHNDDRMFYDKDMIMVFASLMTKKEYSDMERDMNKYKVKGQGYEIYVWNDNSGYEYWKDEAKDGGGNYIQVTAAVSDPEIVDAEKLKQDMEEAFDYFHGKYDNSDEFYSSYTPGR